MTTTTNNRHIRRYVRPLIGVGPVLQDTRPARIAAWRMRVMRAGLGAAVVPASLIGTWLDTPVGTVATTGPTIYLAA